MKISDFEMNALSAFIFSVDLAKCICALSGSSVSDTWDFFFYFFLPNVACVNFLMQRVILTQQ